MATIFTLSNSPRFFIARDFRRRGLMHSVSISPSKDEGVERREALVRIAAP